MSLNGFPPAGKPLIISHVQYFRPVRLTECPDVWGPDRRGPTVFDFLGAGPPGRISCPVQYKEMWASAPFFSKPEFVNFSIHSHP